MKKLILFGFISIIISSCTMHKESAARRRNNRSNQEWHGWSKDHCPQTYGYKNQN